MIQCESVASVSSTLAAQALVAALCLSSPDRQALARWTELSDPWAARTTTRHFNGFSVAHFLQMLLLFANTRALCGPPPKGRQGKGPAESTALLTFYS